MQKLTAKPVESGRYDLVLHPSHLWLTIHESIAHPTELDRALGYEANYAGTSFVAPPDEGARQAALRPAAHEHPRRSRRSPARSSAVGWDDEGVKPESFDIIRNGIFVDYQTTREQAPMLADYYKTSGTPVRSHGCSYAQSWADVQFQRMPNVSLLPGDKDHGWDDLIAATDRGIAIIGDGSFSIDQQRYNAQFGGQLFYEIKGGKIVGMLKDVAYQMRTPEFWGSIDMIGGQKSYHLGGAFNDGKGQPSQSNAVSHGCVAQRASATSTSSTRGGRHERRSGPCARRRATSRATSARRSPKRALASSPRPTTPRQHQQRQPRQHALRREPGLHRRRQLRHLRHRHRARSASAAASARTNRSTTRRSGRPSQTAERLARLAPEDPESMPELGRSRYQSRRRNWSDATAVARSAGRAPTRSRASPAPATAGGSSPPASSTRAPARTPSPTPRACSPTRARPRGAHHHRAHPRRHRLRLGRARRITTGRASIPPRSAPRATEKARASRNPVAIEPGRYTVVLEPTAVGNLVQFIAFALNARAADEGRSFFSKAGGGNKIGEKVVDERVTIVVRSVRPRCRRRSRSRTRVCRRGAASGSRTAS